MRKILAATATALVVISGCASDAESAKASLVDALRNLLESEALTQTISVGSDVDSLVAASEGEITEDVAAKILDSSLTLSGTQADDPTEASSITVLNVAGSDDFEMRFVDGDLYARADTTNLLDAFGKDATRVDALAAHVKGQKGFDWVEDALAGEWVVVRDAVVLTQQLGGTTARAEDQEKVIDDLLESVENNATVTSEGNDEAGEHLIASMPMRDTLQDLLQSLGPAAGMAGPIQQSLNDVPNDDMALDFWVTDGMVNRVAVDITQFAQMADQSGDHFPEGVDELSIVIDVDEFEGTVEPIAGAVEIDAVALTRALSALVTGGTGMGASPGTSTFDCRMLKGAPPEVVELYAKECPELQN